jgi:hypothetical protein
MGVAKAIIAAIESKAKILVVAPASAKINWGVR